MSNFDLFNNKTQFLASHFFDVLSSAKIAAIYNVYSSICNKSSGKEENFLIRPMNTIKSYTQKKADSFNSNDPFFYINNDNVIFSFTDFNDLPTFSKLELVLFLEVNPELVDSFNIFNK